MTAIRKCNAEPTINILPKMVTYIDRFDKNISIRIRILYMVVFSDALVVFKNADILDTDLCHQVGDVTLACLHS
jgi:hypothetical protein